MPMLWSCTWGQSQHLALYLGRNTVLHSQTGPRPSPSPSLPTASDHTVVYSYSLGTSHFLSGILTSSKICFHLLFLEHSQGSDMLVALSWFFSSATKCILLVHFSVTSMEFGECDQANTLLQSAIWNLHLIFTLT